MTPDASNAGINRDHAGQPSGRGTLVPADWPMGPYHVLAIGIDRYAHWNPLVTAKAGAEAVCEVLQREFGFKPDHCQVLLNEEATGEAILAALTLLAMTLPEDVSLLIYFAGHGHIVAGTMLGWWIPVDGVRPSTEEELRKGRVATKTWISNHEIKGILSGMKARHVLLVSDSCYSGDFVRSMTEVTPATDEYVKAALLRASRHALTSGGLHPVQDDGFHGQSVFTHFFLKALQDRTVPWYTAHRLHGRVADGVLANARQMPLVGVVRDTGGELSGEFVLIRRGGVDVERRLEEGSAELKELEEALERDRIAREEAARRREAKEAELAALQERIEALKASQGGGMGTGGNWQQMKGLLEAKKREAEELRKLQQQQAEEAQRRAEELDRLEREERERRKEHFETEWAEYEGYLEDPDIPAEHHPDMWVAICAEFRVKPMSMTPGKLRWSGEGVVEVVKVEVPHLQLLALLRHQAFVAPKGEGRGVVRFAEIDLQIETVSVVLTDFEAIQKGLQRLGEEMAGTWRVTEARWDAERRERIEQARKRFEVERAKYEQVLASPFAGANLKRIAWRIFHLGQCVSVRDPGTPGKLEWGGEGAREVDVRVAIVTTPTPPENEPRHEGPRRLTLADIRTGFEGRIGDMLTVDPGLEFCWIPAGKFVMGSPPGFGASDEYPQTEVTLSRSFWMGRVPVRQRDWKVLTGRNPSHFKGDDLPVENVSWNDCNTLASNLTSRFPGQLPEGYEFRLPTEAEWEYGCRAGTGTAWVFGDEEGTLPVYAWYGVNSDAKTHPVGLKRPNPWGLHDVYGNVWEWCADVKRAYSGDCVTDPFGGNGWSFGPFGSFLVIRGGAWDDSASICRSAYRGILVPGNSGFNLGFRLVLALRVAP